MKLLKISALFLAALAFAACDDTTDGFGSSITNDVDNLNVSDAVFNVTTQSLKAGHVLSTSNLGMLGKVKDSETGAYVSGDYMTQFATLSSFTLAKLDSCRLANGGSIVDGKIVGGELDADSCFLLVSYKNVYGDSLSAMNVKAYEMTKAMPETQNYYSDFDAFSNGFVSKDNYHGSATYNLTGGSFKIYLNKPYIKDGKTYKNYGSYLLQAYEKDPEDFRNNYRFMTNVCPGFYLKTDGGIANVAKVWNVELQFYYKWKLKDPIKKKYVDEDSITLGHTWSRLDGTEEVLQTNRIVNDSKSIDNMVADQSCTYIKSPAGIFTEATLPVESILSGHDKDTLNTVSITFPKMNNSTTDSEYTFDTPSTLLMIPRDSLTAFFENGDITDYRTSYTASYSTSGTSYTKNAYTFNNISNLVTIMGNIPVAERTENWNKVVLIPVELSYVTRDGYQYVSKVSHEMWLTSTKMVKGTDNASDYTTKDGKRIANGPIQAKVIYSKFNE